GWPGPPLLSRVSASNPLPLAPLAAKVARLAAGDRGDGEALARTAAESGKSAVFGLRRRSGRAAGTRGHPGLVAHRHRRAARRASGLLVRVPRGSPRRP